MEIQNMRAYGGPEGVSVPPAFLHAVYSVKIIRGERNFFGWLMDYTNPLSYASNENQADTPGGPSRHPAHLNNRFLS